MKKYRNSKYKKTKLHCFWCGYKFKNNKEVFRDSDNYPLCKDCFWEYLEGIWDEDFIDNILDEIKEKFNGKYNKFLKHHKETMDKCDGCSGKRYDPMFYPKEELIEINGKKYCEMCVEKLDNSKREEVKV